MIIKTPLSNSRKNKPLSEQKEEILFQNSNIVFFALKNILLFHIAFLTKRYSSL